MKITRTKLLRTFYTAIQMAALFALSTQGAIAQNSTTGNAQNQRTDVMGKDSTDLVPWGNIATPNPQTFTATNISTPGVCGSSNGATVTNVSQLNSLCSSGTPSQILTNGSSFAWSCIGNYGTPPSCTANLLATQPNYYSCDLGTILTQWGTKCNGSQFTEVNPNVGLSRTVYLLPSQPIRGDGTYQVISFGPWH